MGRVKEMYYEQLEQREDRKLATLLGITYEELTETDWHIETDESNDGLVYGYTIYFDDNSPRNILDKIKRLDGDNQVYLSSHEVDDDDENFDYEEQYEAIIANKFFYDSFYNEISNVRQLNEIQLENPNLLSVLKRQLYISAIGTLETFLSETFINLTIENSDYFRRFVETFPTFNERKFQLNEIYKVNEKLHETAKKEMLEVIYHNLAKVRNMYNSTFKINFPDIEELSKSVNTRHDLVHRNGKTKDGEEISIEKSSVTELLNSITLFVEDISNSLNIKE